MKHKIDSLYNGWKDKGHKDVHNNTDIRKESIKFIETHGKDEINKIVSIEKDNPSKEDVALGLEIKYLGWLRGIW